MKKAISRRDFLKVVGVSAAALGMTACGGSSASTSTSTAASTAASSTASSAAAGAGEGGSGNDYKLTWNEVNGEDYGATVGAHTFAEKIEELSGGHITIDLYINGTLGSEAESMQGIQMGTLDIFRGNASSLPNCGYVALGWLVEGPRSMFITPKVYERLGKPTDFTLDKMKGLKVRVPETDLMISTMDALGASATAIAYSELYTSLQSGVVDAAENGVTSYMSNSFNEVAPYFITDAHTFGCGVILMNADKWNGFNDAEKGWIKEAALAARSACYEYNQKQEQACFDSFADKGITKLEVSDIEKWQEACAPLYEKQSTDAQDIIAKIQGGNY